LPFGFSHDYVEIMGENWGIAFRWACAAGLLVGMAFSTPVFAQTIADDAAAKEYFEAGRVAFDQADYESALTYFRHAYRTSGRGALLYNIGVAADRLQRDQEAVEAFEQYLETTEKPTRESEVRTRIEALRKSIADKEATERALMEAELRYRQIAEGNSRKMRDPAPPSPSASIGTSESRPGAVFQMPPYTDPVDRPSAKKKKKWPWIVAATAVVVLGGVTAGVVVSQRSKQSQQPSGGFAVNW
jgi:tetratricopeptide (TPR) repeat protein